MKIKKTRLEKYHPEDIDFAQCSGWKQALIDFPGLAEFAAQHPEHRKHREMYTAFFTSLPTFPTVEVETVPSPILGKVILKWTEKLFLLAAEQAVRKINTRETEEQIQKNKVAVSALAEHSNCVCAVVPDSLVQQVDRETKLNVLLSLPQNCLFFCEGSEGIVPLLPLSLGQTNPARIFIILPSEKRDPEIHLGWDGKHFIALYPEAIRELRIPDGVMALMPPSATTVPQTQTQKEDDEDDENEE